MSEVEHRLYESHLRYKLEIAEAMAEAIAKAWPNGVTLTGAPLRVKEYNTVLKDSQGYYVTNRFDPRVVQWCKDNDVKPRELE